MQSQARKHSAHNTNQSDYASEARFETCSEEEHGHDPTRHIHRMNVDREVRSCLSRARTKRDHKKSPLYEQNGVERFRCRELVVQSSDKRCRGFRDAPYISPALCLKVQTLASISTETSSIISVKANRGS